MLIEPKSELNIIAKELKVANEICLHMKSLNPTQLTIVNEMRDVIYSNCYTKLNQVMKKLETTHEIKVRKK